MNSVTRNGRTSHPLQAICEPRQFGMGTMISSARQDCDFTDIIENLGRPAWGGKSAESLKLHLNLNFPRLSAVGFVDVCTRTKRTIV